LNFIVYATGFFGEAKRCFILLA